MQYPLMHLGQRRESRGTCRVKIQIYRPQGEIYYGRGYASRTRRSLTAFKTLLLCSVIGLIVGVCSIQLEKPLQNLAYQWPSWDELKKEKSNFHE